MSSSRGLVSHFVIATLVLNTIAVGLRLFVRLALTKSAGYDDCALVLAFASLVAFCATTWVAISQGHGTDGASEVHSRSMLIKFLLISSIIYMVTLCLIKTSSALVLYRLAVLNLPIRRMLEVTTAVVFIWCGVSAILLGLQCQPISIAWGETPLSEGKCMSPQTLTDVGYAIAVMDIVVSFFLAILPIFLLRDVQLPLHLKMSVIVLLGLGILTSVITVLRLKLLAEIQKLKATNLDANTQDAYLDNFVYSVPELGLALFTASLVALTPLFRLILGGGLGQSLGSKKKTARGSQPNMGPSIVLHERSVRSDRSIFTSQENIVQDSHAAKETSRCANV